MPAHDRVEPREGAVFLQKKETTTMGAASTSADSNNGHQVTTQLSNRPRRPYSRHGLTVLKRAVKGLGGRVVDRRTALGKALAQWRAELINDLGGPEAVST